jgi:hypothetical protein
MNYRKRRRIRRHLRKAIRRKIKRIAVLASKLEYGFAYATSYRDYYLDPTCSLWAWKSEDIITTNLLVAEQYLQHINNLKVFL